MKNVLITGGAGFIGTNFVKMFIDENQQTNVVNLDALTYAGNIENIEDVMDKHTFIRGNICDRNLIDSIFNEYDIDTVINFAAESHVDRSILDPSVFIKTNVEGTQTLLDVCKKYWKLSQDKNDYSYRNGVKYVQISTDETYGDIHDSGKFTEKTPISPNSPYSASKAGADLLVMAYNHTFGLPINITRCSNNYGPYQFPEKLIPLVISNALKNKPIPVYGDGLQIRDWIYVGDHCSAISTVLKSGRSGEIYNIGSDNEVANIDIIKMILNELDKPESLIKYVSDRPGHDRHYAIDNSKIYSELHWSPKQSFKNGLKYTISWYLDHEEWLNHITSGDYMNYYNKMYSL